MTTKNVERGLFLLGKKAQALGERDDSQEREGERPSLTTQKRSC